MAPHFGHQANSGIIVEPQLGQGVCTMAALAAGIRVICSVEAVITGTSIRTK